MKRKTTIPDAALTEHIAVVGKTGSGKTYTAKGIVERLLEAGQRVCILDPTGAWWGLRTAADGKKPGFPVIVFGGDHGDVPINEHAGEAVAKLLAGSNIPAIIDLSDTWLASRRRFAGRFFETLYKLNRTPLHLVIDEADEFYPQGGGRSGGDGEGGLTQLMGSVDRIIRRGRIKGFRVLMITQRPAVLHKNALTQASTLIAMRLSAPQDRKAIEDWIKGQADAEVGREVLGSLSKLQRGEGWVWSPEHGGLERTMFPKILTYDSSATPDDSEVGVEPPRTIAEVDLGAIEAALGAAVAEAEANDPAKLKRRVQQLQAQLEAAQRAPIAMPQEIDAIVAKAKAEAAEGYQRLIAQMSTTADGMLSELRGTVDRAETISAELRSLFTLMSGAQSAGVFPTAAVAASNGRAREAPRPSRPAAPAAIVGAVGADSCISGPFSQILAALAWWQSAGVRKPSVAQLAFVSRYSPKGGTFSRYLSGMTGEGLIERQAGRVSLTDAGRRLAGDSGDLSTLDALHESIRAVVRSSKDMGEPHVRILDQLLGLALKLRGQGASSEMSVQELAGLTGYSAEGGTFSRYLSALSGMGLIVRRSGRVRAGDLCFPSGLD